ncbi:hypothetical protein PHYSODRAFT_330093, partial [Phytophthora sojae]
SSAPGSPETVAEADADVSVEASAVAVPEQCEPASDVPVAEEPAIEEAAAPVESEPAVDADVEAAVENLVADVVIAADMVAEPVTGDESSAPESPETVAEADADVSEEASAVAVPEQCEAAVEDSESVDLPPTDDVATDIERSRGSELVEVQAMKADGVAVGFIDHGETVMVDHTAKPLEEALRPCESVGLSLPGVDGEVECLVEDVVAVLVAIDKAANMKNDDIRTPEEILF